MFKRFWWILLTMLPIGALIGLLIAAVVTYMMPKMYESEAVIELRPHISASGANQHLEGREIFATEFEVIVSRRLLEKVVLDLDLTNRWNVDKETALQVLKKIVKRKEITGTDLISIRVRHTNKVDARDIALEVVNSYKEYRTEIETRDSGRHLQELKRMVQDQEDKVEEQRKVLSAILRNQTIEAPSNPEKVGEPENGEQAKGETRDEVIKRAIDTQDYVEAKRDFETDQELLKTLKLKLMSELIELKLSDDSVMIHEVPVIAELPVSPKVTLNLMLGIALGLLISPLLALPLMWLLNRTNPAKLSEQAK